MRSFAVYCSVILLLGSACASHPTVARHDTATVVSANRKEIILKTDKDLMFLRDLPPETNWHKVAKRGERVTLVYDESGKHYRSVRFKNGMSIFLE